MMQPTSAVTIPSKNWRCVKLVKDTNKKSYFFLTKLKKTCEALEPVR
jgi:hypothetical protein